MTCHPFSLENKRILVTGASSGIGKSASIALSQAGAKIILVARDAGKLSDTLSQLSGSGHVSVPYDLTQLENIPVWMKELAQEIGVLDGLLHCAGLHMAKPLKLLNTVDLESIWRVNVSSAVMLSKGFRQKNVRSLEANIVLMSSVVAEYGEVAIAAYASTKGAIHALIKSLAIELASEKIRVNGVAPGVVKTGMTDAMFAKMSPESIAAIDNMHPLGLGDPKDIAHAIVYLMSPAARWVTGEVIHVDGGYHAR